MKSPKIIYIVSSTPTWPILTKLWIFLLTSYLGYVERMLESDEVSLEFANIVRDVNIDKDADERSSIVMYVSEKFCRSLKSSNKWKRLCQYFPDYEIVYARPIPISPHAQKAMKASIEGSKRLLRPVVYDLAHQPNCAN